MSFTSSSSSTSSPPPGEESTVSYDSKSSHSSVMDLSKNASTKKESILWAGVIRDETLLVQARSTDSRTSMDGSLPPKDGVQGQLDDDVLATARGLLNLKPTMGWENFPVNPVWPRGTYRGLRFHVYQEVDTSSSQPKESLQEKGLSTSEKPSVRRPSSPLEQDDLRLWIFACVYNPAGATKRQVQSFLEKIVLISEIFRETDKVWQTGDHHSCEDVFAPILEQRMKEMTYWGSIAMADEATLDLSQQIIKANRDLLNKRIMMEKQKKTEEAAMLRQMEEMNRSLVQEQQEHTSPPKSSPTSSSSPKSKLLNIRDISPRAGSFLSSLGNRRRAGPDTDERGAAPVLPVLWGKDNNKSGNAPTETSTFKDKDPKGAGNKADYGSMKDDAMRVEDALQQLEKEALASTQKGADSKKEYCSSKVGYCITVGALTVVLIAMVFAFLPPSVVQQLIAIQEHLK